MNFDKIQSSVLNDEIQWGIHYREEAKNARKVFLTPKASPMNLQLLWEKYQITKQIEAIEILRKQTFAKPVPKHLHLASNTLNRVDRSTFTKKQYIDFLSTPHRYAAPFKKTGKLVALRKKLRRKQKCTARLIELAKPTRIRVYNTWKDYQYHLPAEVQERLNALLQTDHTLDPAFARCCFKNLDNKRKREKYKRYKKRRKMNNKKRRENKEWLKMQVELTVDVIIDFLQQDTLLNLNYKQMLISNTIIDQLVRCNCFEKRPMRNSSKPYQKAIVDVVDQLSVWMDTIVRYIDVQTTESELSLESSIRSLLSGPGGMSCQGEGEEDYDVDEYDEDGKRKGKRGKYFKTDAKDRQKQELLTDSESYITFSYDKDKETTSKMSESERRLKEKGEKTEDERKRMLKWDVGEEEGTDSYGSALRKSDGGSLARLIEILSKSSPEFLAKYVDEFSMPGVCYEDVLIRVKNLHDQQLREEKEKRKNVLEMSMVEWAKENDPDKVNNKLIKTIQGAADIISECIKKEQHITDLTDVKDIIDTSTSWDTKESSSKRKGSRAQSTMVGEDDELTRSKLAQKQLDTDQDVSEISSFVGKSEPESSKTTEIKLVGSGEEGELAQAVSLKDDETGMEAAKDVDMTGDIFGIIPKHKPSITFDHAPDTICCLTIKVWATWLLEVANNAQKWSEWLSAIIAEIKQIASIMRGEVLDQDGNMVMFYIEDWRAFVEKVETMIISWRQYSMHVKDLTDKIIHNFHGKRITCCPKCLEDNLIVNIAVAHDISQQLAEAMNTASYWRRWLDSVMMETVRLTSARDQIADNEALSDISSFAVMEIIEIQLPRPEPSEESIYEIEEYEYCQPRHSKR